MYDVRKLVNFISIYVSHVFSMLKKLIVKKIMILFICINI